MPSEVNNSKVLNKTRPQNSNLVNISDQATNKGSRQPDDWNKGRQPLLKIARYTIMN